LADCTALTATRSIPGRIAPTNSSVEAETTWIPRSSCTFQGKTFEVNSMSSTSTVEPSGNESAIGAIAAETVLPTKTSATGAPTSRANDSRDRVVDSSHGSQVVAPTCQSRNAACSASQPGRGGNPYDAVFNHPGCGSHNSAKSLTELISSPHSPAPTLLSGNSTTEDAMAARDLIRATLTER
jgi:hypothetical protein